MVNMAAASSSRTAVYAALAGNVLVAVIKIGAAIWTGSSAMTSEAVHSIVDTSNEVLLLYGYRRASRPADESHPLGYGRELYFWSFIVALLIFALGSGISLYQGIVHVAAPEPIEDPIVSFIVLGLSFLFEGGSWLVALRRFRSDAARFGYYQAFVRSKDPPAFMVLLEDSAALVGIVIAAAATSAAVWLSQPVWDGVGSILIGILLGITSVGLARESKSADQRAGAPGACATDPRDRPALTRCAPGERPPDGAIIPGRGCRRAQRRIRRREARRRYRAMRDIARKRNPQASSERRSPVHQAADERALSRRSGQTPGRKVLVCTSSMESRLVCASAAPGWQMPSKPSEQKSTSALMPRRRGDTSAFRVRMLYSQVVSLIPIWNGGTRDHQPEDNQYRSEGGKAESKPPSE